MALLTALRERLESRGIRARVTDIPELALRIEPPGPSFPVWVFVGYGGRFFSWQNAEKRHSIDDLNGAAEALAEYVRGRVWPSGG